MRIRLQLLRFATLVALNLGAGSAFAQTDAPPPPSPAGEELTVWVMTMGPGSQVWERFGHNAIRIRDELRGTDIAYNYGMFSFQQEDFLLRFVRGHMDYWMEGFDSGLTASGYIATDRAVWLQELNLTPAQRAELRDFLEWNALPENRIYRYHYYLDNCSTRVRDAIDRVSGGQIEAQTREVPSGTTFREHTRRLTGDDLAVYTGLMAALAQPVDREISAWEEMFLPMELLARLRDVTIVNASGERVPLVRAEEQVYAAAAPAGTLPPGDHTLGFLLAGSLLGGMLWATARLTSRRPMARFAFGTLAAGWCLVAGVLGWVLLGLWALTDHTTSYRNENLFFFNPILIVLAGLLPVAAIGGAPRMLALATRVAIVVAAISLLGFVLQVLPMFYQRNGELIALALPVNLALAAATWEISRGRLAGGRRGPASRGAPAPATAAPV